MWRDGGKQFEVGLLRRLGSLFYFLEALEDTFPETFDGKEDAYM